jgi:hypothetical protein
MGANDRESPPRDPSRADTGGAGGEHEQEHEHPEAAQPWRETPRAKRGLCDRDGRAGAALVKGTEHAFEPVPRHRSSKPWRAGSPRDVALTRGNRHMPTRRHRGRT